MDLGLKGKKAFILGGGRGLGRGIADALAAEGTNLAIASRQIENLQAAARAISRASGNKILPFMADLTDWATVAAAFQRAEQQLGGIDILVNLSGGPAPSGVIGVDATVWQSQFESMVLHIMKLTDLALPGMRARQWGRVLTVASSTVIQPLPSLGVSNTLRSALVGWSKSLAGEVSRDGITVNLLLPGRIATDRVAELDAFTAEKNGSTAQKVTQNHAEQIPLNRYGTIEEFGAVAAFLASMKASYITGSMIRIDGGAIKAV